MTPINNYGYLAYEHKNKPFGKDTSVHTRDTHAVPWSELKSSELYNNIHCFVLCQAKTQLSNLSGIHFNMCQTPHYFQLHSVQTI